MAGCQRLFSVAARMSVSEKSLPLNGKGSLVSLARAMVGRDRHDLGVEPMEPKIQLTSPCSPSRLSSTIDASKTVATEISSRARVQRCRVGQGGIQ